MEEKREDSKVMKMAIGKRIVKVINYCKL